MVFCGGSWQLRHPLGLVRSANGQAHPSPLGPELWPGAQAPLFELLLQVILMMPKFENQCSKSEDRKLQPLGQVWPVA